MCLVLKYRPAPFKWKRPQAKDEFEQNSLSNILTEKTGLPFSQDKNWMCTYLLFANTLQINKYWEVNYVANTHDKCHICLYFHSAVFTPPVFWYANHLCHKFTPQYLHICYINYLQGANLCKSIFPSREFYLDKPEKSCSI